MCFFFTIFSCWRWCSCRRVSPHYKQQGCFSQKQTTRLWFPLLLPVISSMPWNQAFLGKVHCERNHHGCDWAFSFFASLGVDSGVSDDNDCRDSQGWEVWISSLLMRGQAAWFRVQKVWFFTENSMVTSHIFLCDESLTFSLQLIEFIHPHDWHIWRMSFNCKRLLGAVLFSSIRCLKDEMLKADSLFSSDFITFWADLRILSEARYKCEKNLYSLHLLLLT